jgi:hypothetical protein
MIRRILSISLITVFVAVVVAAQAGTTVRGRVLAVDGAPYPSAAVTLRAASGVQTRVVYTDRDGMFSVANVTPGSYAMTVRTNRSQASFSVTAQPKPYSDLAPVKVR